MKDLLKQIIKASNIINERSRKGPGNFIITSPKVAEAINNLDPEYRRKIRKMKLDKINEINLKNHYH